FTKKDENGKETLKGAEFELKDSEGNAVELKESDGNFQATGLKADSSYVLTETKAPDGYSLLRDPVDIKVDANGKVTVDKAENVKITDNKDVTNISFDVYNQLVENITFKGTKQWDDDNNKYGERPEDLEVQLQRRLSDDADWENYKTQDIDAENVDLDEHIWEFEFTDLPKENNAGQTYQYRVIENDVPNNYAETLVDNHTIINKHVQHHFDYEVNKVDAKGESLAGAEFKLTDSEGKTIEKDGSSTDSKFVWKELDVGEYTLEETKAPDRHHGVNSKFKVTVNEDGSVNTEAITKNVDFKENTENSVNIVNDVNDFELNFTKKDENGKETLKGAEFELKDSEGNAVELKESDGNFQASGLKADSSYVLTETKAPDGYSLLRDPVNIKVDAK
ncbi:SpaA isopeptide-forming pilin-related protein, partial [Pediococcus claussenii]